MNSTQLSEAHHHQRSPSDWLALQASLDWPSAGLPPFTEWEPALLAVMRLVAHASAPMILMVGPEGVLAANAEAQSLLAEPGSAINGRSVLTALPGLAPFYSAVLKKTRRGETLHFSDQPNPLNSDSASATRWFNLDFTPVTATAGNVIAVLGTASEVTPHIRRVQGLSDSEQRLRLALESSGMVGIWTLDVRTRTSTADANVARMYGLSELDYQSGVDSALFIQAIHPDDRPKVNKALGDALATETPYRCRYRVVSREGGVRWVITSARPAYNEHKQFARMLGVVIDVTDQMETASALADSRFQFQTLTETLPQIVWSCDAEGRHDYFSARWSEFTGIEPKDIVENTWKQLVYPDHWPMVSTVWDKARTTGEPYDIDYRFRHRSGEYRWLRVMALPIRDELGQITRWCGTSTDVHDNYLIAQEREKLRAELERVASEDQLTQVLTRRAFIGRATAFITANDAALMPATLLMLDIDYFKSINDAYGHPAGDKVLAIAARRILASTTATDLVGRLGGEEFAVLLPACSRQQAGGVAERIRESMAGDPITLGEGLQVTVTVSIGAVSITIPGQDLDQLLQIADKALYSAKSAGRNRAVFGEAQALP
ncbi:sensor domain-containing diguanylate cyclase [Stagnimonas aquatica]|nr:sensor domain-containing diguanylate cyclase [Stagnimonas aquatica]